MTKQQTEKVRRESKNIWKSALALEDDKNWS